MHLTPEQSSPPSRLDHPALAYILKGYPRISESFISNEILLLESLGFSMHLFPMRLPRENFTHASVEKIQAKVNYLPTELLPELHRLLPPNILLALRRSGNYKKALQHAKKGLSRGKELLTLKHLFQAGYLTHNHLTGQSDIQHLHGHFAHSPTSVTLFASLLSDIPFSFTAHAKDIYTSSKKKLKRKIDAAKFVVTCTEYNKKYLQNLAGDTTTPIYCVYHGIDLSLFNNGLMASAPPTQPFSLLTVARMTEKKGLPTLYKALARLKNEGISFQHTLIGDGDDRDKILNLIDQLQLQDSCSWLGTRTHEQVLEYFKKSDLFILGCEIASNGDRDGIPNVLVESLAMGVPALSTNVSAIPEILINEKTGLTVDPKDPEMLAQAMMRALMDVSLRNRLIEEGKRLVQDKFDNSKLITSLASIYRENAPAIT